MAVLNATEKAPATVRNKVGTSSGPALEQKKAHSQEWLCHGEMRGQSWDSMALEISS